MRDPARINKIVERLRALWHAHPDQRLGQLVSNLGPFCGGQFYAEDDFMLQRIEERIEKGWP